MMLQRSSILLAAAAISTSLALAQQAAPPIRPPAPTTALPTPTTPAATRPPTPAPAATPAAPISTTLSDTAVCKKLFRNLAQQAEAELVPLVVQRVEGQSAPPRLELQIDLHVIARWLAANSGINDDAVMNAFLRVRQFADAATQLDATLPANAYSPIQRKAADDLHQLTFGLPSPATPEQLDTVCRLAGLSMMQLATDHAITPASIAPMRPSSLPPFNLLTKGETTAPVKEPPKPDPAAQIPRLAVSPALRQQLLRMYDMTSHPANYQLTQADAQQLATTLNDAIDIAAGLSSNAGVSPEERATLEKQLAEAVALSGDRRLRDLAKDRIASMSRYRQVLASITRLNLTPANYQLLHPAFEYAQKHPEAQKQILSTVERFVDDCVTYDALPPNLRYDANPTLAKTLDRPYDDARKGFERIRNEFLGHIELLGSGTMSPSTPTDLDNRLQELHVSMDVLASLSAMPATIDTLAAFKPRPVGGIEKRIAKETTIAASPGMGPIRQDAAAVLKDLVRLAETARQLEAVKIDPAATEILSAYAGIKPAVILTKWRADVADVASEAAAGTPLTRGKIDCAESLPWILDILLQAAQINAKLKSPEDLQRWADWGLLPTELDAGISNYRGSISSAVAGFLSDNPDAIRNARRSYHHAMNIAVFVVRNELAAQPLPRFATPVEVACAKLITPLSFQPFAGVRYFSLASVLLNDPGLDPASTKAINAELNKRIK